MLGKTFKGMTDVMLAWQTKRLRELAVDDADSRAGWSASAPNSSWRSPTTASSAPPATRSSVTLRFARVVRYREDKRPEEADTVEALLAAHPEVTP
ncbi:hypothetical protein ACQ4WX_10535 [Streptomyces lasalocidi]